MSAIISNQIIFFLIQEIGETGYDNQAEEAPSARFDGEVDSYSDEAAVEIQALINGKKRKVFENGDEFSPATKKRSAVIEMAKKFANYTIHEEKQVSMFKVPYEHLEPSGIVGLVGKTCEQKQGLMFEVPYEHLEPSGQIVPSGNIVPTGQTVPSGPMNHNGSLGDNGKANYGGLVGPYSQKPPVAPMAIGLSGHSNVAIGLSGHSNAANKLKQQLEQQDQVQFYQKIKHELQVEEHQQMVKKFYQQQKLAFDFPKVIFPSGPVYRNGPHSGQATSQTVCSNNFRRPRLSVTICASPMRPAEIVHENFIIAKNWLGQECKV